MPFLHKHCNTEHYNSNKYVKTKSRNGFERVWQNWLKPHWLYEGEWLNDKRHGFGTVLQKKSEQLVPKYRGNFSSNKRHGQGSRYYTDAGYYVGQWKKGLRFGYGRMWYGDGTFYDGEWKCDKRHGKGVFVNVNGDRYEGSWKNDVKMGLGRFYHLRKGQIQEGTWYNDQCIISIIEDIPFQQTVVFPTHYPIQSVRVINPNKIMFEEQVNVLKDDDELLDEIVIMDVSSSSSVVSSDLRMSFLQEKYKYV